MKLHTAATILPILLFASISSAKDFPKWVFRVSQLDEAVAKATEDNKAITFLRSEENASCPKTVAANTAAFAALKRNSVIVYLPYKQKDTFDQIYSNITTGFKGPKMGNVVPQIIITSPDMMTIWKVLDYPELKERPLKAAGRSLKALCSGETTVEAEENPQIFWFHPGGENHYEGSFQKIDEQGKIVINMGKQGTHAVPPERLCAGAVAYARKLNGTAPDSTESTEKPTFGEEKWTSSDGKIIEATFVSLADGEITLKKKTGKEFTFTVNRLSQKSRDHAEKLAGVTEP